jgi:hypothetical protein
MFTKDLLKSKGLNRKTQYNLICFSKENEFFKHLDVFISYKNETVSNIKNIELYLEVEENKIETIRREIVEKNHKEDVITIFSRNELMARDFIENNPVTKHLPKGAILADTTVKSTEKINCFFLGLTKLSEEILRQHIIENQLITVENNKYKNHPLNYYIYDETGKSSNYIIKDLLEVENVVELYAT